MLDRRLISIATLVAVTAVACENSSQNSRAEGWGRLPREQAGSNGPGNVPKFNGQHLYADAIVEPVGEQIAPIVLPLDVQRDAIHLGGTAAYVQATSLRLPRGGDRSATWSLAGASIPVHGDDSWLVWHDLSADGDRRIEAARTTEPERSWLVLTYPSADAIGGPMVVGDRVAVVLAHRILHAPLTGGETAELVLTHPPKTHPSSAPTSDGRRLIWISQDEAREFIFGTDARFETVERLWEQPKDKGLVIAAVPVGDTIVFANIDWAHGLEKDIILRVLPDGDLVEVLPRHFRSDSLRLLSDGEQAWMYREHMTWWIGPRGHGFFKVLDDDASAIAADDGLLVWQQFDGVHVAGLPTVEFTQPFAPHDIIR